MTNGKLLGSNLLVKHEVYEVYMQNLNVSYFETVEACVELERFAEV